MRKWIRNLAALELAAPSAKCLASCSRVPSPLHAECIAFSVPSSPPTQSMQSPSQSSQSSTPTEGCESPGSCPVASDPSELHGHGPVVLSTPTQLLHVTAPYALPQPRLAVQAFAGYHNYHWMAPVQALKPVEWESPQQQPPPRTAAIDDAALVLLGLSTGTSPRAAASP